MACVGNIIFHLLFGISEPLEDEAIHKRAETAFQVAKTFNHPFVYLVTLFPFLKYFRFLAGKTYEESIRCCEELSIFYKRLIQEHRETINYEGEPRDYTDAFLMAQRKHNPNLNEEGEWSDKQLIGVVGDMFFAGIETTTTTLEMFVYYMIHNPEIQKKLYEELDRVIGKDKTIAMSDQPKLPYLNACLQEIQRITVVAPINLFHRTSEEITIDGYNIPKDTIIIPEFEMVHKDEKQFPDPWKFDPTRFLDAKNNFVKDDRLTPFSVGKRACVGEALARMELFIFAATFFHRFEFLPEEPNKLPKYEFNYTLTKNIKAFNCRIIERK
uniref:Cytochrome P450 n=1 Tax=Panagrolaimus davidi TaxID=227884 RepID=A0A914Q212_9BILA